jgi:hypothetical protein
MLNTEKILKTYTARHPREIAGYLSSAMAELNNPSFVTISESLLRKICVDVKRDWNKDHPGGLDAQGLDPVTSGEKTFQNMVATKRFVGVTLLLDKGSAFLEAAKLSDLNLENCIMVKYDPQ